jgi:hypothetical protein
MLQRLFCILIFQKMQEFHKTKPASESLAGLTMKDENNYLSTTFTFSTWLPLLKYSST